MKFSIPRRLPWLMLISALVIFADRLTKTWVGGHFDRLTKTWSGGHIPLGGSIPVVPHFLRISHWLNDGMAFSLFADSTSPNTVRWCLATFGCCLLVVVFIALVRLGGRFTLITVALALVFGGALGNLHDRILYGSVVDFIEVHIFGYHWPDFNIADSSIVTGACLIVLDSLLPQKKTES